MEGNILEITGEKAESIDLFPKSVEEEIARNIRIILTTIKGTVPLDRNFGIAADFIDEPHPKAMMKLGIYVAESIQEYEPRVEVLEVDFKPLLDEALNGRLCPVVKVRIK